MGVYVDKFPMENERCLTPTAEQGGNLVAYVNTMVPSIYKFIMDVLEPT